MVALLLSFYAGACFRYALEVVMRTVDVCLVNPPHPVANPYNLALPYLSANLKKHGFSTKIIDASALGLGPEALAAMVSRYQPRIIGVTIFSSSRVRAAQKTVALLKKRLPHAAVVCGGVMATLCPEEFAPLCDMVVMGPGEERIVDIARNYPDSGLFDLPGIAWLDRTANRLVVNPVQPLANLDTLPFPDWERVLENLDQECVFGLNRFADEPGLVIPLLTSRGCPFRCSFCSNWIIGSRKVLTRSPENIVSEMKHFQERFNITRFHFCDDNFGYFREHVEKICDEIIASRLQVSWRCTISADAASHECLTEKMSAAGCRMAFIGAESGDDAILKSINKPITTSQIRSAVRNLKKAGIPCITSFIVGLPEDTVETVLKTIRFAAELHADGLSLHVAEPMPKTLMWHTAEKDGGMVVPDDIFMPPEGRINYTPPGLHGWCVRKISRYFLLYWGIHNPRQGLGMLKRLFDRLYWPLILYYGVKHGILRVSPHLPAWAKKN